MGRFINQDKFNPKNEPGYYKYLRFEHALDDIKRPVLFGDESTPLQISSDKAYCNSFLPSQGIEDQQIMTYRMVKDVLRGEDVVYGKGIEIGFDHGHSLTSESGNAAVGTDVFFGRNIYLGKDPDQSVQGSIHGSYGTSTLTFGQGKFSFWATSDATSSVNTMCELYNISSGTVSDGYGGAIKFINESDIGLFNTTGQFEFISTDVTSTSSDGKFQWKIDVANSLTTKMYLENAGLTVSGSIIANGDMQIDATNKISLDGGNDTNIQESSADVLDFNVGGINMLKLDEANGTMDIRADNIRVLSESGGTYAGVDGHSLTTAIQQIQIATVTISEAEMNALHTTEKVLVAAPGSNKVIIPTKIVTFTDRDALTTQSVNTSMWFGVDGSINSTGGLWGYIKSYMRLESGDRVHSWFQTSGEVMAAAMTTGDNQPLTAKLNAAITSGSIDSCKVVVMYYVFDNS